MKRFLAIFLAFSLIFNFFSIPFSYADTIDELKKVEIGDDITNIEELNGSGDNDTTTELGGFQNETGQIKTSNNILAKIISGILEILDLIHWPLMKFALAIPTIDGCIFNTNNNFKLSFFDAKPAGLAGGIQGAISAIYNAFRYLVTATYIVVLVYLAIRMMLSSVGRQKAHYKELFKHWLIGLLLLFSFHWVMAFIIWLSNTFVDILAETATGILRDGLTVPSGISAVTASDIQNSPITSFIALRISEATAEGSLLDSILGIFLSLIKPILLTLLLWSAFSIIVTYFRRLFTIAVLILTFPLVALSYVFDKIGDKKAQTLSIWLKEFMVNVMVQPIHAILLVFIAMLFSTGLSVTQSATSEFPGGLFGPHIIGAIMSIVALRLIPVGEDLLKKLFQINSSMGPGSGGIAGSMAKAGMAYQGAKAMAGSLKKVGSSAFTARRLNKRYGNINKTAKRDARNAGKDARNAALAKGTSAFKAARAGIKARHSSLKNNSKYHDMLKELKEATGTSTIGGANAKALAQVFGVSAGVGAAITGADSGKFLSTAGTNAVIGSTIAGGLASAPNAVKSFLVGDVHKAEDYKRRAEQLDKKSAADIDKLSKEDKKKIAAELGISVDLVKGANKNKLIKAYRDMGVAARFGANKDELKKFTSFHGEAKNIENGLMPDGSGPLDYSRFSKFNQTKNGVLGELNGEIYQLNTNGNPKLDDGKAVSCVSTLKGQALTQENLMTAINNQEYNELSARLNNERVKLESKKADKNQAQIDVSNAEIAFDNAKKALARAQRSGDDTQILAAQEVFKTSQNTLSEKKGRLADANTEVSTATRNISTIESDMKKIYVEERRNQLDADMAFHRLSGEQPQYAETAFKLVSENPSSGTITRDADHVSLNYTIGTGKDKITSTYIINNDGGIDTTLNNNTNRQIHQFIGRNDEIFTDLANAQSTYASALSTKNPTTIKNAELNLQQLESQARNAYSVKVAEFTSNPSSVSSIPIGATSEIQDFFVTNQSVQQIMGHGFISEFEPLPDNGFEFGICDDLTNTLETWNNKQVTITLSRYSDTILHYEVRNSFTNLRVAEGDINVDAHFNNKELNSTGNSITISHNKKGAWFKD